MDFETAMELVADRDGTVDWKLVYDAAWWLIDNGHREEVRRLMDEINSEPSRGKNESDI
jgi:hypothetical protein